MLIKGRTMMERKMNINIRQENENDHTSVYTLVKEAFAKAEHSDGMNKTWLIGLEKVKHLFRHCH